MDKEKRKLLVIGCGGGATSYLQKSLRKARIKVGHEYMKRDGLVSWIHCPPSPQDEFIVSEKQGRRRDFEFEKILHVVRHPIKTAETSSRKLSPEHWNYIQQILGFTQDQKKDRMTRGLRYWVGWHKLADSQAEYTFRIEDIKKIWPDLMQLLNVEAEFPAVKVRGFVQRLQKTECEKCGHINIVKPKNLVKVTWEAVEYIDPELASEAKEMAVNYGYEI